MGAMILSANSPARQIQSLYPLHLKSKPLHPINLKPSSLNSYFSQSSSLNSYFSQSSSLNSYFSQSPLKFKPFRHFFTVYSSKSSLVVVPDVENAASNQSKKVDASPESEAEFNVEQVGSPIIVPSKLGFPKLSLSDQAFFLLLFIACTTTASFIGFLAAAIPTMSAMGRAAIAFSKLADTAREEIPSTMTAIRLTSLEISDLLHELRDLSQEVADGVSKSTQAVQAADAGIRKIGSFAREQTMSMIEERANLPVISLQPVVAGAAQKTSHAVGRATRTVMNIISRRELSSENEDGGTLDSQ